MASPAWWTWVWVNSRSWCLTRRPGVLQSMGSQRVGHNWATELKFAEHNQGFGIANKVEIDVFLEVSCFFDNPMDVGNLISGSSAFSKYKLNIWKFMVHVLLKPGLENFECYFASLWDECNCAVVWAFFGIAFLWDWNENWPSPVLWPLLSFPDFLAYWVKHFHSIIFRIWNSSPEIPSPPLALFVVMLPKAHFAFQDVWF